MDKNFEQNADKIKRACDAIVEEITRELDDYIEACSGVIKDTEKEITNAELDSMMMNIPAMLYWIKVEREKIGIKMDLARKVRDDKWNEAFLAAEGNVTNQKVKANAETMEEAFDCIVYERAYNMIAGKEQMAFEVYQAVKKVASRREGGFRE